jgi:gliding motility-associated lipoprotein GldD
MGYLQKTLFAFFILILFTQCEEPVITPKPRAYPRITYPEKGFKTFTGDFCNMTFQYPAYSKIERNKYFFGEEAPNPCWFNLYFPDFDAKLHCSYMSIDKENTIEHLQTQAFKMSDWHTKKASFIDEKTFTNPNNAIGMTFDVEGPAASPFQFYITDSLQEKHFFRAAFYFNSQINTDSLAPIYNFIKEDLHVMVNSFKWKE